MARMFPHQNPLTPCPLSPGSPRPRFRPRLCSASLSRDLPLFSDQTPALHPALSLVRRLSLAPEPAFSDARSARQLQEALQPQKLREGGPTSSGGLHTSPAPLDPGFMWAPPPGRRPGLRRGWPKRWSKSETTFNGGVELGLHGAGVLRAPGESCENEIPWKTRYRRGLSSPPTNPHIDQIDHSQISDLPRQPSLGRACQGESEI